MKDLNLLNLHRALEGLEGLVLAEQAERLVVLLEVPSEVLLEVQPEEPEEPEVVFLKERRAA
jgi:hypothetical protein